MPLNKHFFLKLFIFPLNGNVGLGLDLLKQIGLGLDLLKQISFLKRQSHSPSS